MWLPATGGLTSVSTLREGHFPPCTTLCNPLWPSIKVRTSAAAAHASASEHHGEALQLSGWAEQEYGGPDFALGVPEMPIASALTDFVGSYGACCPEWREFQGVARAVKRDRPFAQWWQAAGVGDLDRPPSAPPSPEPPPPPPSVWDPVFARLDDLFEGNDDDLQKTRRLLIGSADALIEIFVFYCQVGSLATEADAEGHRHFCRIEPHRIHPGALTDDAADQLRTLWQLPAGTLGPLQGGVPTLLLTLRQWWQLGKDMRAIGNECTLGDMGHIFAFASRQSAQDGVATSTMMLECPAGADAYLFRLDRLREALEVDSTEALPELRRPDGRWTVLGATDPEHSLHPNNRQHVFRFMEGVIRLAHHLYSQGGVGDERAGQSTVAGCFRSLVELDAVRVG